MAGPYLIAGGFQDSTGTILQYGRLTFQLSQNCTDKATGLIQICAGETTSVALDNNGNVIGAQPLWSNDLLSPSNTYYLVTFFTQKGQRVWGPNALQLTNTGGYIYLNNIIPQNPT